ncbi:hypothetical protein GCM10010977_31670 [Citricoccus zhacaiensis]|uniref:ApeA N-terminal domain-containing protein n=2 Tax=Citricoccus zhacaiensis TaxID=489142 RepID=A0ABQ2MBB3_9MICC|nr:hypothetical protein GCM10010977_31670 [Citricoccus zhacaiensis]
MCIDLRKRLWAWFTATDEDITQFWLLNRDSSAPPLGKNAQILEYEPEPIYELWNLVYGDGPHSDFERILVNSSIEHDSDAGARPVWHQLRMIAYLASLRGLVIAIHNSVLDYTATNGSKRSG